MEYQNESLNQANEYYTKEFIPEMEQQINYIRIKINNKENEMQALYKENQSLKSSLCAKEGD